MLDEASMPAGATSPRPRASLGDYARFIRLSHTLFSLPLVIAGLLIGGDGWPGSRVILLILLAAFGARTAALALNRIIDRRIDALNPRTVVRELPSGRLSLTQAWVVTALGGAIYLLAARLLGPLTLLLSPLPLIVFAGYPFLKRFTPLCHFGVGLGLALSPLGGWVAITQSFHGLMQVLPLAVFGLFWVAGFDMIYSTLDREFDTACGLYSLPVLLGAEGALRISFWCHLISLLSLLALWWVNGWSRVALLPLAAAGALLWLEQRLARHVELAFFRINIVVGAAVLLLIVVGVFV